MLTLPPALEPFRAYRQFIVYRLTPRPSGKADKHPIDWRTGAMPPKGTGGAQWPEAWASFEEASAAAALFGPAYGVGFVFTERDPFWFLDIDAAFDGVQWSPLSRELLAMFPEAAVEVSSSGTGLHVFGSGPVPAHGCRNQTHGLEFYTSGRFVALTGVHARGSAAAQYPEAVTGLVARFFPVPPGAPAMLGGGTLPSGPVAAWSGPVNDDDLLRLALKAKGAASAFGGRASFADLWERNVDALAASYPSNTPGEPYDASAADAALAQHLAFWTGNDGERIVRLMRQSGLAREKYDRDGYLEHFTVPKACARQTTWASRREEPPAAPAPVSAPPADVARGLEVRAGLQFMDVSRQLEHFRGCVYVRDVNRVLTPEGSELDQARFRVMFGGYSFAMDAMNEKETRNAWECFTESRAVRFPRVAATCFRPELPPGAVIAEEGVEMVNAYTPVPTTAICGDPAPFLGLLERILPDARDRSILLSYLAALIQHKGRKFQWWPVLQGAEGNGKSFIIDVATHAIGRKYSHSPNAAEIAKSGNKFNGWIKNRLFIAMEEVHVPHRREFLEEFKTTITNTRIQVEAKGVDQIMIDNRANGIMCTNHRDGVPVTVDTRRYAIFYTAQQCKSDLVRDGMDGEYFPDLYDWALGRNAYAAHGANYGLAVVNYYLQAYPIAEEFNPAGMCQRAPRTSSTDAAIEESRGAIEQEVLEAIGQGLPGFAGGWVSSLALERLLERIGMTRAVSRSRRRDVMLSLGYDWHPALVEGRVHNVVLPDNGKPKLFIKRGHLAAQLKNPADIARAYSDAQTTQAGASSAAVAVFRP